MLLLLFKGVNCWLVCNFNWFNRPDSTPYWHARYRCRDKECGVNFEAQISSFNDDDDRVEIEITSSQICEHEFRIFKKARITGQARANMALKIGCDGVANTLNEEMNNDKSMLFQLEKKFFLRVI